MNRVLRVTTIVALLGAVGGALGGIVIASIVQVHAVVTAPPGPTVQPPFLAIAMFAAAFGATFGLVLGPLYSWSLLRRVPLWRAIGETALAAAIGAGGGFVLSAATSAPFAGALVLSAAAALRLRVAHRPVPASIARPSPVNPDDAFI
jgi:hypothetical protein